MMWPLFLNRCEELFCCLRGFPFHFFSSLFFLYSHNKKNGVKDDILGLQALTKNLVMFLEASNWCPGHVFSQYLTSIRCIFLMLIFSSWTLRASLLFCLASDTWCKGGVVGNLGYSVG